MLNPYNISDIENYYLIARNYIHNLRLSSDDNKYIKKQLKKNKTYSHSTVAGGLEVISYTMRLT